MPLPAIASARTPRHGLPYLFPGQAQKEAFVNEALARLDALVQPVVLDERATPPAAPSPGDSYLLAQGASGTWSGHDRDIAVWAENQWLYLPPREGARVYDLASGSLALFTTADGWRRIDAPALPTGGATQDIEARGALAAIVAALRAAGVFSA
ncbi:MAG: DUF2793 domain-containing protein [Qipengyuania sp.]|nr:DUF2793 domain-containing protein [Qipengyuania sp.]